MEDIFLNVIKNLTNPNYELLQTTTYRITYCWILKYYLYVIELDKEVGKLVKFRKQIPKFLLGNRCFYIGQSAKKPSIRFRQHKDGYKSNTYAKRFGMRLVPEFYEKYNPIPTRKDAEELEEYVTMKLRQERYGVWSN